LTQLYNRRFFDRALAEEWKRLQRAGLPLALLMCDIDYFKAYNDTYGHQLGDTCIREVARAINLHCGRTSDVAARYGGEEFAVVLPQTTLDGATAVARLILEEVTSLQLEHRASPAVNIVSISVGVACLTPNSNQTPEQLIDSADRALYESKSKGRNRITCFQDES
ncbi:MAG: diguanylate cyclase, partial [Cyanobacteria bacterium J06639_1]